MSSLLLPNGTNAMEVMSLCWQTWTDLIGTELFNCIKMDIEGGEFSLVPTMREYLIRRTPDLLLSVHPHLLDKQERPGAMTALVQALEGYRSCLDTAEGPVDMRDLLQEPLVSRPASYLFTV